MFSYTEAKCLYKILGQTSEIMGYSSCNDLNLREFLTEEECADFVPGFDAWLREEDPERQSVADQNYDTQDFLVVEYLRSRLMIRPEDYDG